MQKPKKWLQTENVTLRWGLILKKTISEISKFDCFDWIKCCKAKNVDWILKEWSSYLLIQRTKDTIIFAKTRYPK